MPTDTKECPDCAETIKAKAKVCKHCGYRFEGVAEQLAAEEAKAVASLRAAQDKGEAMVLAESHSLVDFTLRSMICQRIMPSEKAAGLLLIWREKPAQMQEHIEAYQSNAEGEIDRLMQPAVRPIEDLANSATLVFRTRVNQTGSKSN